MKDDDWRHNLKVGDEVHVTSGYAMQVGSIQKVARLTKTQIVLENGAKYNKAHGQRVGQTGYGRSWIREPTADMREKILRESLAQTIESAFSSRQKVREYPIEILQAVVDLL